MTVDLVVRNGKLVSPRGIIEGGIAIDEGVITTVAKTLNLPKADTTINADGNVVLPGVLDGHTHTTLPPENSKSGTKAAAKGGITTILEMPGTQMGCFNPKEFKEKKDLFESTSYVDFCLNAGCSSGYKEGNLTDMWRLGATGVKFFVSSAGPKWPQTFDGEILDRFHELARCNGLALIHAENDHILRYNSEKLRNLGRTDYAAHLECRPPIAEIECGQRIIRYLKETSCRGLIVHTSLPETVWNVRKAKREGVEVYVETCPQYLYLTDKDVKERGPWVKFAPPARSDDVRLEMWRLLGKGWIDTVATDHAPYSIGDKERGMNDIFAAPNGIPGLETFLPLLLNGFNDGYISLECLSAVISENPARMYGIYPKKGSFLPGSDGDFVIVDLKKEAIIKNEEQITACGWSPYDGFKVKGMPSTAAIRGKIILEDGEVVGKEGNGIFISRC